MSKEKLYIYDTTLRDGQQTHGIQFSTDDKLNISRLIDELGVDYIEGGWPGANPTDSDFFSASPKTSATLTAFGMTKRDGFSAENDDVLSAVINANTPTICLVERLSLMLSTFLMGLKQTQITLLNVCLRHILLEQDG